MQLVLRRIKRMRTEKLAGFFLVLALHGAIVYVLLSDRFISVPERAEISFAQLIGQPTSAPKQPEIKPPPLRSPVLVTQVPDLSLEPESMTAVQPAPIAAEPTANTSAEVPTTPIILSSDLAVACPQRSPPEYPSISRRLKEQGHVVLQVEIDETGRVAFAKIKESSGFRRLDEAGLEAVKQWRCNAPIRNGEARRALALQPFDFILDRLQ